MGDGGMMVTQDEALGEKLAVCRNHGSKPKYFHKFVGGNFRLDTIQAAGLIVKLKYLDGWSDKRRRNAAKYDKLFAGFAPVTTPVVRDGNVSIFNQYVIRAPKRNELQAFLKAEGIGTEVYYPLSMHEQECFKTLGCKKGDFPVAETAESSSLALPIYPELTDEQITYVADKVKQFLAT
jgi:dTDP-4-amino-4,6-dideoxygalactose transaminase